MGTSEGIYCVIRGSKVLILAGHLLRKGDLVVVGCLRRYLTERQFGTMLYYQRLGADKMLDSLDRYYRVA